MRSCVRERNGVLKTFFPDRKVEEIEGEFAPASHEPNQSDQEYRGEFRFVNAGPQKLREMVANVNQTDLQAVQLALRAWDKMSPSMGGTEPGEPYRGEPKKAIIAKSMRELTANVKPVEHVFAQSLSAAGIMSEANGEPRWIGIFDFDELSEGLKELPQQTEV